PVVFFVSPALTPAIYPLSLPDALPIYRVRMARAPLTVATGDPGPPPAALVRRARAINRALAEVYPDARCELDFDGPFQLLCATVLSAQCTDVRVNQVTP